MWLSEKLALNNISWPWEIQIAIDQGKEYGALLTDLSKVFYCLTHKRLIAKLLAFCFPIESWNLINDFFNCYLAAPQPTMGHCQGADLTNLMFITAFTYFNLKVTGSLLTKVGTQNLVEHQVMFEPRTFLFWK